MNASELKYQHEQANPGSHYFTRRTMHFFCDTMRNYGVREYDANTWELYRKRATALGIRSSAYFDRRTFKRVHPEGATR